MSKRNQKIVATKESQLLKKLRMDKGLSLRKLADPMDYSFMRVHQMESGRENVADEYVRKFLDAINLKWEEWEIYLRGESQSLGLRDKSHEIIDEINPSQLGEVYGLLLRFR